MLIDPVRCRRCRRLLIGNDESGSTQLHELAPDGHRSVLTSLGEPCWGRYLPGQRAVVVSADDGGTERAQLWLRSLDSDRPGLEPLVTDPAYIHTLLDVAADRVVYATNRRNGVDFDVVLRTVSSGAEQGDMGRRRLVHRRGAVAARAVHRVAA